MPHAGLDAEGTLYGGRLVEIIHILRDGENGCPWDKVQTHASIRKNFLEETCEALEAIELTTLS